MMGDGIIDLPAFSAMIDAAGYDGPIEVEILNPAIWDLPRAELMRTTVERFERCVLLARRGRAATARAGAGARRRGAGLPSTACAARRPISCSGTLTVVSPTKCAGRVSSMPAIETWPGTSTPASRSRISTPIAASSLAATIASGSVSRASSRSAAAMPSS